MRKFGLILTLIITIALCCGCTKDISGLMESDGDVLPAQPSTPYIFYKEQFYTLDYCESLVRELQGNGYDDYKTNNEKASQIELELYDCGMHAVGYELGQEKDNFTIVPYVDIQEFI